MDKYSGHFGLIEKFGKTWRWTRYGHYQQNRNGDVVYRAPFRVEPYYQFDPHQPCPRPDDKDLTLTIGVRGTTYVFPARRMPCSNCDGGIRRKLKLRPHGGVCYCDDGTVLDFDREKMTEEQLETIAMYHLDLQMSSFW